MRKRNVAVVLLTAILIVLFTGCSGVDEVLSPTNPGGGSTSIEVPTSDHTTVEGNGAPPQNLR